MPGWDAHSWRLWRTANALDFYSIDTWPHYLQIIAMTKDPRHRDIWVLFKFFVNNGMDPRTASNYMIDNYKYDKYQAMWLEKHASTYNEKYFDMIEKRVL